MNDNGRAVWQQGLPEICHGQIWRLFTPCLLHFSLWHWVENSTVLLVLGTLIEVRQGVRVFGSLVLAFGVVGVLVHYLAQGPVGGGLSGVATRLIGYLWIRGTVDPGARLRLGQYVLSLFVISTLAVSLIPIGRFSRIVHGLASSPAVYGGWFPAWFGDRRSHEDQSR